MDREINADVMATVASMVRPEERRRSEIHKAVQYYISISCRGLFLRRNTYRTDVNHPRLPRSQPTPLPSNYYNPRRVRPPLTGLLLSEMCRYIGTGESTNLHALRNHLMRQNRPGADFSASSRMTVTDHMRHAELGPIACDTLNEVGQCRSCVPPKVFVCLGDGAEERRGTQT